MESRASRTIKCTKKRTKFSATTPQEALRRRRVTRSMQRKMSAPNVQMKENSTNSTTATTTTSKEEMLQEIDPVIPKLQKQYAQLACKENVLENSMEGLGLASHTNNVGPLRPTHQLSSTSASGGLQPQQTLLTAYFPSQHIELSRERVVLPEHPLTPSDCDFGEFEVISIHHQHQQDGHVALASTGHAHYSHAGGRTKQQACKMKISQLMSCDVSECENANPLPRLQWARSAELWQRMRSKDVSKVAPEAELRLRHPGILSSMRIILLDWMMEVCEEYKLHRETYYLAVDMFDRFMDVRAGVQKEQLQLLGVTCLFVASKIEEIYPPKAGDFAYVTDGACSVAQILDTELIICKILNWKLNHGMVTVNTWLNTYMQLGSHHLRPPGIKAKEFEIPAYSCTEFTRVMKLLDLCSLDVASRQFGSSVLAAAAVYLQSERSRPNLSLITGFELRDIQTCVSWMQPCAFILNQNPLKPTTKRSFSGVIPQDIHNIQTHDISIAMLEDAIDLRQRQGIFTPQYHLQPECSLLLTPPRNAERRCLAPINTTAC